MDGKKGNQTRIQWRHACLKLMLTGDVKLTAADIRKSLTSKEFSLRLDSFEKLSGDAKKLASTYSGKTSSETMQRLLGMLECHLVMSFLEKKSKDETWKRVEPEEACHRFVLELGKEIGQHIVSPWAAFEKKKSTSKQKQKLASSSTILACNFGGKWWGLTIRKNRYDYDYIWGFPQMDGL